MIRLQSIRARLNTSILRGFLADERGATMTEFIITLPIFIVIFAGIANLSRLNKAVVRSSGIAYMEMWDSAMEVQQGSPGIHASVSNSGGDIKANMSTYKDKQPEILPRQIVRRDSVAHGNGLSSKGTLGESEARVRSAHHDIKFRGIHSDVTANIEGVVGSSTYAKRLFDDSASAPKVSFSSGSTGVAGAATRMVHATKAHYGEEMGDDIQTVVIAGQKFKIYQYYNTLVSPHWQHEDVATSVARGALDGLPAYDNMLGVAKTQRLSGASQSVSAIKGTMQ